MRKTLCFNLLIIMLTACASVHAEDLPWKLKLPFQQATINYTITGSEKGSETLYISDHGKRRAKYHDTTMSILGMSTSTKTVEIIDQDWVYHYDLTEGTGTKTVNPAKTFQLEYDKLTPAEQKNARKNSQELGASMMSGMGGETRENGSKILGYSCDVTTLGGMTTVHIIHGTDIPLRSEMSMMGMNSLAEATKIDTKAAVTQDHFIAPAGITAVHDIKAEAMVTGMIQKMMGELKQPDGAERIKKNPTGMMPTGTRGQAPAPSDKTQETAPDMEKGMKMLEGLFKK